MTCVSPMRNVIHTLILIRSKNSGAQKDCTPFRASNHNVTEAYTMAFLHSTQTRPKFTDTYWIVPCYETTPYGKVSFTRQDRCIFIAMFKDSRLICAGRQPVGSTTYGKHTRSQKEGVKHTMLHEGIEEIFTPKGMVNITPPSTITNIVTVQGVAHA
ncbi:hypothetical protein SG1649 [Sodalis glossinidius str. 'morsitans']|uniref:Uncharacterized protein n=1 Tax=Sodalis glossinidius (strain morsitans) TaxID=343509 RepID=Q2NSF1_SODGM|nr:hypothetical protein SG1649 [Sodalis glossinidius str. 'morsitans']